MDDPTLRARIEARKAELEKHAHELHAELTRVQTVLAELNALLTPPVEPPPGTNE